MRRAFTHVATRASTAAGHWSAFALALLFVISWGVAGPILGFSEPWMLALDTTEKIVAFLMLFAIQNTTTRTVAAMRRELDELVRADPGADETVAEEPQP